MSQSKPHSAAKAVSLIVVITALSQPIGFIREMILAAVFGTGIQMDAYSMALGIIGTLPVLLSAYIGATYIPEYAQARGKSEDEAQRFYSLVFTLAFIFSIAIAILGCIFTPLLVSIFAPGYTDEVRELTIQILRIVVWITPIQIAMNVWASTLNARKAHVIPILAGTSVNLFVIPAALFLVKYYGIWALIGATTLNLLFQCVILYITVVKQGQRYLPVIDFKEPRLIKTVKLAVPALAISAIAQINTLVDRTIASGLPSGSVSSFNYGLRLYGFVPNIIFTPFTTVLFSRMSERAANKDKSGALDIMWRTVEILLAVALPVCAITMFMRAEIVRIVYERGAFGNESTYTVGLVLMFYIWMMVISAVSSPLSSTFVAWQDMRGMILRGSITVVIDAIFSLILSRYWGIIGAVIGTLIGSSIYTLILLITLRRRWGPLGMSRTVIEGFKMLACAAACGLLARILREFLPASNGTIIMDVFRFGTVTVICMSVFYGLAILLRVRSVKDVYSLVMAKMQSLLKRKAKQE